ncbi:MAG: RNA 3'-terminal phosphate cyclase [Candidatus Nezhaarchaeales archaeon]
MIEIDGSMLEGGGQILRMSVALSAVIGKPVRVFNIRIKRSNPGLRPQHLTAIKSLATLVQAETKGLSVGSREIEFKPREPKGGSYVFDVGTAGSTTLVLQALMPASAFAFGGVHVEIRGGTNNPLAPPVDYVERVLIPIISKMGFKGSLELLRRGFYPRGGGLVRFSAEPIKELKPIRLTSPGEILEIKGLSYSSRLPNHVTERMAKSAEQVLKSAGYYNVDIALERLQPQDRKCALDPGCGLILYAITSTGAIIGSDGLGERGKPAEVVGSEVANNLVRQLKTNTAVDKYMGDQLIVYMAIANGISEVKVSELTLHTATCIEVAKKVVGARFKVEGDLGAPSLIRCEGVGLRNPSL